MVQKKFNETFLDRIYNTILVPIEKELDNEFTTERNVYPDEPKETVSFRISGRFKDYYFLSLINYKKIDELCGKEITCQVNQDITVSEKFVELEFFLTHTSNIDEFFDSLKEKKSDYNPDDKSDPRNDDIQRHYRTNRKDIN